MYRNCGGWRPFIGPGLGGFGHSLEGFGHSFGNFRFSCCLVLKRSWDCR
jgi:hypothetical protein